MVDAFPPFTREEIVDLAKADQYIDVREETVARMMSTLLEWMPDVQGEERSQRLAEQVHNQHQELIAIKNERGQFQREVERLKRENHLSTRVNNQLKELLEQHAPGVLAVVKNALFSSEQPLPHPERPEDKVRMTGPPGSVVQRTEVDLPVQNEPLTASLSPEKESEVPEDPLDKLWWRNYFCDLTIALIAEYPKDCNTSIDEWAYVCAANLLGRAKVRFPSKP